MGEDRTLRRFLKSKFSAPPTLLPCAGLLSALQVALANQGWGGSFPFTMGGSPPLLAEASREATHIVQEPHNSCRLGAWRMTKVENFPSVNFQIFC